MQNIATTVKVTTFLSAKIGETERNYGPASTLTVEDVVAVHAVYGYDYFMPATKADAQTIVEAAKPKTKKETTKTAKTAKAETTETETVETETVEEVETETVETVE